MLGTQRWEGGLCETQTFYWQRSLACLRFPGSGQQHLVRHANSGNDNNDCLSASAACKTIGHAITLAASGVPIMLAPGDYTETITIPFSLNIVGGNAQTTAFSGGYGGPVVTIPEEFPVSVVNISGEDEKRYSDSDGGGISDLGQPTVLDSIVSGIVRCFLAAGSRPMAAAEALRPFLLIGRLFTATERRRVPASNVPGRPSP